MSNLLVARNVYTLYECLCASKGEAPYVLYDATYDTRCFKSLEKKLINEQLVVKFLSIAEISDYQFENIYLCAAMEQWHYSLLGLLNFDRLFLLEEGIGNYVGNNKPINAVIYVNHPEQFKDTDSFSSVLPIRPTDTAVQLKKMLELNEIEGMSAVIFTSPMDVDYGIDFVSEASRVISEHFPYQRVVMKLHPRDFNNYSGEFYPRCISGTIPAQFMLDMYKGLPKVFFGVSTALMDIPNEERCNVTLFKLKCVKDKKYNEQFETPIAKLFKIVEV